MTSTAIVNAHGALILLGAKVSSGQLLAVKNPRTNEELACRVVFIGPSQLSKTEIGVEFLKPAPKFWRIDFPPEDWTPFSDEP